MSSAPPARAGLAAAQPGRAAPRHALLLRDFVNTIDLASGTDEFSDPASLEKWLSARGLIPGQDRAAGRHGAGQDDLDAAVTLRAALRAQMRAHHRAGEPPGCSAPNGPPHGLGAAAGAFPLRVSDLSGTPTLVPADTGVRGALGWVAAAIVESAADHSWERLKICAEDTCQWAFLDSSKNRSKHWCSMQECGNRAKTRAYRARRSGRLQAGAPRRQ